MVSVVIPVYNSSNTIYQALQSVLKQTYNGDIEIIVVNDGSTDNSLQVINDFCRVHTDVKIKIISKENGGASSAKNVGMKEAKGDYIALLDSDDIWHDDKLSLQMDIFNQHSEIDFLGCNRNEMVHKRFFFKKLYRLVPISAKLLLYKNIYATPTVIFKRKILETVGFFDESLRYMEDCNYFVRVCYEHHCMLLNESHVTTGGGKPNFGHSGLSGNLLGMEKGELKNIRIALTLKIISYGEFIVMSAYSIAKYIRRLLVVKTGLN